MLHKTTELDEGSEDTRSTLSSTSDSAVLQPMTSLYSDPTSRPSLSSSDTKTTSAQPRAQQGISTTGKQTSSNKKNKTKLRKMDRNAETQAALKRSDPSVSVAGRKADQELFDQVLTSIAQTDVIANSGHELYRRVNDCARDYMEAKQIVERREHEIAAISTKIESMQATIDDASKHLHKAQSIAAEAIDSSVSEQYRLREHDNLTNILIGMTDAIAKGDCHIWTREKVNQCLEVSLLFSIKNGSPSEHSGFGPPPMGSEAEKSMSSSFSPISPKSEATCLLNMSSSTGSSVGLPQEQVLLPVANGQQWYLARGEALRFPRGL